MTQGLMMSAASTVTVLVHKIIITVIRKLFFYPEALSQ